MKTLRFLLVAVLFVGAVPVLAQDALEGTVRYELTQKIEVELPPEMAHMQDQIPSERTSARVLHFDETATLMMAAEPDEADDAIEHNQGGMQMRVQFAGRGASENATYVDLDTGEMVERKAFLGRTFLVTGEQRAIPWKLTGEQSEFLGYLCQKAVATVDSTEYEAWFTPQIPVPAGPEQYGGLPGLIMLLSQDDGMMSIVATEVTLGPLADGVLAKPEGGKAVTEDEYRAIIEERMKDMEAERGGSAGGTTFRIIRRGN